MAERRLKVVIVDDERTITHVLGVVLGAVGLEGMEYNDGHQALESALAADPPPDLFMIDWTMPKMDGFELTRALRHKGFRQPVIWMWSMKIPEEYLHALGEPEPFVHLHPKSPGEIVGLVVRALRSSRLSLPTLWHAGLDFTVLHDGDLERESGEVKHRVVSDQEALKGGLGITISDSAALTLTRRSDRLMETTRLFRVLQRMIRGDERLLKYEKTIYRTYIERFLAPGLVLTPRRVDLDFWRRLDRMVDRLPLGLPSRSLRLFSDITLLAATMEPEEVRALAGEEPASPDEFDLLWGVACGVIRLPAAVDGSVDRLTLRRLADARACRLEALYFPSFSVIP